MTLHGQDPETGEFMYTIKGFKVTGLCTQCDVVE